MVTRKVDRWWGDSDGRAWRMVGSFALPNEAAGERLAVERVEAAVGALQWPAINLAAIGQAVGRAAPPAWERGARERGPGGGRLVVRLFVQTVEAAAGVETPAAAPGVRGSGFFLVQREEDGTLPLADTKDTAIELFLFQE